MMAGPRVVIIGSGPTGAALADELSFRGWTDITVVAQGSLRDPARSSAVEAIFQNHHSKTMSRLAQDTVAKFRALDHSAEPAFRPVGSIEVATNAEALARLRRRRGWGRSAGLDLELIGPEACAALQPQVDAAQVLGGLYNPTDGLARTAVAVNAQLRRAEERGVMVLPHHRVTGVLARNGSVVGVETTRGRLDAEIVMCCAGRQSADIARSVGLTLPTAPVPRLVADPTITGAVLRQLDEEPQLCLDEQVAGTADGFPLLGPLAQMPGLWVAAGVRLAHSAGVAGALAEWLMEGRSIRYALHECDVQRFERYQLAPSYVGQRAMQQHLDGDDVTHPLQPFEDPRPLRLSPFYTWQDELGAVFLEHAGWERPEWYAGNAPLLAGRELPRFRGWSAQWWDPIIGAEAQRTRESVALFDLTWRKRVEVSGPEAEAFMGELTAGGFAPSVGTVAQQLLLDQDGRIRADITVARLDRHRYHVGCTENLELEWLRSQVGRRDVVIRDITGGSCCLALWGPHARAVLQGLSGLDFDAEAFPYGTVRQGFVGDVPVTALRISAIGELGYEFHTTADVGMRLWETLWTSGAEHAIIAAGHGAFNSLRLEKGYRVYGADVTSEHDPYEAGLELTVRPDLDLRGRDALPPRGADITRRLTCLTLEETAQVILGQEPVVVEGAPVGRTTSAGYGYTVGRNIAYAWLPAELATPGQRVVIEASESDVPALVTAEPLFDPAMTRARA